MFSTYQSGLYCILGLLIQIATAQVIYQDLPLVPGYLKAHGIVMGLVFTVCMPLGVVMIRILRNKRAVWFHAAWQLFSWVLMISGLASGIRVGKILDRLHNNTHTILGTVVVVLLLLQPFIGLAQHFRFRKTQTKGKWNYIHIWYGRLLIILGIINGGLGLKLAANTTGGEFAYGLIGGIFGIGLIVVAALTETGKLPRQRESKAPSNTAMEEMTR